MHTHHHFTWLSVGVLLFLSSCSSPLPRQSLSKSNSTNRPLGSEWFDGKAEMNSFALRQARYGEIREGKAMLLFVTEDFSRSKQVKLDAPKSGDADRISVLKMNLSKSFVTGIYPYHMLLSSFSPIGENVPQHALKVSASIQEWCGHAYVQLNQQEDSFLLQGFSYFESEVQTRQKLPLVYAEDELWNLIRIQPDALPTGRQQILPSLFFCRLKHKPMIPVEAQCTMSAVSDTSQNYEVFIPVFERKWSVTFEKNPPYKILSWMESYPDGAQTLSTEARLIHSERLDYWNLNSVSDTLYRKRFSLDDQ
ncbi:MAG TPA: hypothetical protein VFX48_05005 [Saprospiraceae bacterium]|nr:hypothetical protein [Saprospiraceae bacterium]